MDIQQPDHFAIPFDADDIGMTVSPVKDEEARAVIGDVMARIPEHRDQALRDLQQLTADPKDNEAAHRGLAGMIFARRSLMRPTNWRRRRS
jgi:hypothetical protein